MSINGQALLTRTRLTGASSAGLVAKHITSRRAESHHSVVYKASVVSQVPSELFRLESPIGDKRPSADSRSNSMSCSQPPAYQPASSKQEDAISWCSDASMPKGLSDVPYCLAGITDAYLLGSAAVAAVGQLQRAGYDWAHAALLVMARKQALAAVLAKQKLEADEAMSATSSKPLAARRCCDNFNISHAEADLDKAKRHLHNKAEAFGWHLLSALNVNGHKAGLAFDNVPSYLQAFTYHLLLKSGCISSWGLPIYRQLPAIAASIRPGVIVTVPLQQYLAIAQHTPMIHRQDMDGTWWGDAEVRIYPFQVVTEQELAKALGPDMLRLLFESGGGFAADLASAAANVGLLDGATAEACSTSSTSSLAELLLSKWSRACVGVCAAALARMWTMQQQETSSIQSLAALAVGDLDCSCCCSTCACGGSGGSRRGSITAVGSEDFDGRGEGAALVPVCKTSSSWKNMGNAAAAARASSNRTRLGLLRKAGSVVRHFFRR